MEPSILRSIPNFGGTPSLRRSYRCYNCNYAFHISPAATTSSPSPSSFRCPRCHHSHLISHYVISPPSPALPKRRRDNHPPPPATTSVDPSSCSICLEDFVIGSNAVVLPCKHYFHKDCIRQWLGRSKTCPLCRHKLTILPYKLRRFRSWPLVVARRDQDGDTLMIDA